MLKDIFRLTRYLVPCLWQQNTLRTLRIIHGFTHDGQLSNLQWYAREHCVVYSQLAFSIHSFPERRNYFLKLFTFKVLKVLPPSSVCKIWSWKLGKASSSNELSTHWCSDQSQHSKSGYQPCHYPEATAQMQQSEPGHQPQGIWGNCGL